MRTAPWSMRAFDHALAPVLLVLTLSSAVCGGEGPAKVEVVASAPAGWHLTVNGQPFPIHGAGGGDPALLEKLKAAGGNCVRTWGIDELEAKDAAGRRFIDRAHELGIMVIPGIWLGHERHGFDYGDKAMVEKQRQAVVAAVRKYMDHPAVLMWGLGNEMEGPAVAGGSIPVYHEVEELAKLIKREDASHPVMSVIAFNPAKIPNVMRCCPSLDVIGINCYGSAAGAGEGLKQAGWTKPFAITEFGIKGPWEVPVTSWGAPYEQTSQQKAASFFATNHLVTQVNEGRESCLGTVAFLWGWKQERTATWFGMFLPTREKLPQVDAMTYSWTGHWPANRCPIITSLDSALTGKVVKADQNASAVVVATDPDGDTMTYQWELTAESVVVSVGGDHESAPETYQKLVVSGATRECVVKTPAKAGDYRLYVTIHDGKGSAATANLPFRVAP